MNKTDVLFREAQPEDFPTLALVIERANAKRDNQPLPESITRPEDLNELVAKSKREGAWTDVALIDGRIVGVSLGYPSSQTTDLGDLYPEAEYMSMLMVEPELWGKGVASALMNRAAERARQKGKQQLILLTREQNNTHARQVYEHKGYVLTDFTRPSKYGVQVLYALDLN